MQSRLLPLALGALALACAARPAQGPAPTAPTPAEELALGVLAAMGGAQAWADARHVHWNFFGAREHWWDKHTGDVRIVAGSTTLLMNVHTREGEAYRDGTPLGGEELDALFEQGYGWWVNDSYWMFMPYKLLDPGVHLEHLGPEDLSDGRPAQALSMTFDAVGLTPGNRYVVRIAEDSGLVEEWSFYAQAEDDEPRFTMPWSDWEWFGGIRLAAEHGRGHDWAIEVREDLAPEVYTDP